MNSNSEPFSLCLQRKRLFFDLIYGLGSGLAYVCVCPKEKNLLRKRIEQKAKCKCETVGEQLYICTPEREDTTDNKKRAPLARESVKTLK